jgi:hypothetical protein
MMDISLSTRSGASDVPDAGWLQEEMIYVVRRMHTCTQSPRAPACQYEMRHLPWTN